MITRSKARAMKAEAEAQVQAQKRTPIVLITRDATNLPISRSQTPNDTQPSRPAHGQNAAPVNEQSQRAAMDAEAIADIFNQLLAAQPPTAQSTPGQQSAWQATFNPLIFLLTAIDVWSSFKKTLWINEKVQALSSMAPQLLVHWLGIWTGFLAITCSVLLLHLFDALVARRFFAPGHSAADRVEASSALFLQVALAAKKICEWLMIFNIWLGAIKG